jgi:hypothetical protein
MSTEPTMPRQPTNPTSLLKTASHALHEEPEPGTPRGDDSLALPAAVCGTEPRRLEGGFAWAGAWLGRGLRG